MKFHRVLLFTEIQMDITAVGDDLHVLLTSNGYKCLGCTAYSYLLPDSDPVACETTLLNCVEDPDSTFVPYVADKLCKEAKKNVLCTGGLYYDMESLSERDKNKLYENIDEIIWDWIHFLD